MIRGCIFDLGGTIVDRYSLTPFLSLKKAFLNNGIHVNNDIIFKDMGKSKKDHIIDILINKDITNQWINLKKYRPTKKDSELLFNEFNDIQLDYSKNLITILPETKNCIDFLRNKNIKIGATTGFNKENMNIIKNKLEFNNIFIDNYVSSSCIDKPSRPHPHMINKNLEMLNIANPRKVIKVDDTLVGIQEGINANCITVAVARWSVNMGINNIQDAFEFSDFDVYGNLKKSREILNDSGADYVINTLNELPYLINKLNLKK